VAPAAGTHGPLDHYRYVPANLDPAVPAQVLVVLHGMGGNGKGLADAFVADAEANRWVIVAPNFTYGDWRNPEQVRRDDMTMIPALRNYLQELPSHIGVPISDRYMLMGFSRGAQVAQRFASFYPESTIAVAALSGGTYTLPVKTEGGATSTSPMRFPYGLDGVEQTLGKKINLDRLTQTRFLIGVGARDNVASDVPRQWDSLLGTNRVERAQAYHAALTRMGIDVRLFIAPNLGHELGPLRDAASGFLRSAAVTPIGPVGCVAPHNPIPEIAGF
jgi:pimeloyl-ACP methyl ester carboxylesterase